MKQLFNYCPVHWYETEMSAYPGQANGFLRDSGLDGLELYVYGTEAYPTDYTEQALGVHLKFWPYWMDFWRGNKSALLRNHGDEAAILDYYYGARNNDEWLEVIRKNIQASLLVKPEYLVWHVADCDFDEIYSFKYKYSDAEVIDATIEIVNSITSTIPDETTLLFENLWWPGLRLTDPHMVDRLFSGVKKNNIGIMLDTGHLLNTNLNINSESDGMDYICDMVNKLGAYKDYIYGTHLSCSLSGSYQKGRSWEGKIERTPAFTMNHITNIDQHKNFKDVGLKKLFACIEPRYLVHELYYDSLAELSRYINVQKKLLDM